MVIVERRGSMISPMAALYVSELEAIKELPRLLAQVERGDDVIIERGDEPVALLTKAKAVKRSFEETVQRLRESARVNVDNEFAADVQAAIEEHRQPHTYPAWE